MTRSTTILVVLATAALLAAPSARADKPPRPEPTVPRAPAPDAATLAAGRAKLDALAKATRVRRVEAVTSRRGVRCADPAVVQTRAAFRPADPSTLAPSQREKLARGEAERAARVNPRSPGGR